MRNKFLSFHATTVWDGVASSKHRSDNEVESLASHEPFPATPREATVWTLTLPPHTH